MHWKEAPTMKATVFLLCHNERALIAENDPSLPDAASRLRDLHLRQREQRRLGAHRA
jgi:hypothetical protein